ncbi:MAG: hypothetical protein KF884_06005 [Fimbriimonadaceae bacterium]|nr:hypothetical protein [Fimbriimonadaceae bacterium]QYK59638.1 MAG: hypothetical protein KF884_06005 [Fimbriimonadaceae bacterium]
MTRDKAREFFSDYNEGTLDAGLKLAFERALREDAQLAEEFSQFKSVFQALEGGSSRSVDVPHDLHDKIMARIDKAEWEAKQKRPAGTWGSLRLAVFGGAAVVALVGAVMALLPGGNLGLASVFGGSSTMNAPKNVAPQADHVPTFVADDGSLRIQRESGSDVAYSVTRVADGALIAEGRTSNLKMDLPVVNQDQAARLVEIKVGSGTHLVALPGQSPRPMPEGRGNVRDFALALADTLRAPVQVDTSSQETLEWTVKGQDPESVAVVPPVVTVQALESGLLVVGN